MEYRIEQHAANLGAYRHRSSGVELSIRNRGVVGSNPTGGSRPPTPFFTARLHYPVIVTLNPLAFSDALSPDFSTDFR